jgi:hypothetical protein
VIEFRGLKIDLNALGALITAIGGLILIVKGSNQRKKKKENSHE